MADIVPPEPTPEVPAGERHDLPSGGWAELRDVADVQARDRKIVMKACVTYAGDDPLTDTDLALGVLVAGWSFPEPLPREDIGAPGRLSIADYDALARLVEPGRKVLFPSFEVAKDPDSPTPPSAA